MFCSCLEKLPCLAQAIVFMLWATALECDILEPPSDGQVSQTGTLAGSVATYSCNQGFTLVGEETRVCQANGEWSDEEPFCKGKPVVWVSRATSAAWPFWALLFLSIGLICGSLPNPKNGQVTFGSTRVGSSATYRCDKGFVLVGKSSRVCQANGEWSSTEPQCQRKQERGSSLMT